jgi:hypothetical protein
MALLGWLIFMIVLGLISAALSFYNKNYFVRVFDDVIGREEEDTVAVKLGRGFVYGFLFPVYLALLVWGAVILLVCLIVGAIVAGIVFVLVWITEKIIPREALGNLVQGLFTRIGVPGFPPAGEGDRVPQEVFPPKAQGPQPAAPAEPASPASDEPESPFPGGGINRTRVHTLD